MSNEIRKTTCDALVVGGRCAGTATALALAQRGCSVVVVDRQRPGLDTVSSHALMRGGVFQLARWGLLEALRAAGTPPVHRTDFHYGDSMVTIEIPDRDGVDALYAPRRTVLDPLLARSAREAGVEVRYRTAFVALRWRRGRVVGATLRDPDGEPHEVSARWVIGADGRRSTVAREVAPEPTSMSTHAAASILGYFDGVPTPGYDWRFRPGVSGGAIPTNDGLTCVFASLPSRAFRERASASPNHTFREVLARVAPDLAAAAAGRAPVGGLRVFPGAAGFFRAASGPGWALVGDAGYFKDPATAHGITDALRDAELCAASLIDDDGREFGPTRDALSRRLFEITDEIASFEWSMSALEALHIEMARQMKREVEFMQRRFSCLPARHAGPPARCAAR